MAELLRIFPGYDDRQPVALQVLMHSIYTNTKAPVAITPLVLSTIPITRVGMTSFTYGRFIVPWLCNYKGIGIFMDSDVLVRSDLSELLAYPLAYPDVPVFCVKGKQNFEWSSVMVFNNELCTALTPDYINDKHNKPLQFDWAKTVGELPKEWNHLVGYDQMNVDAKLLHFTQGIPCWPETRGCNFSEEWLKAFKKSISTVPFDMLMGRSVHIKSIAKRLRAQGALVE